MSPLSGSASASAVGSWPPPSPWRSSALRGGVTPPVATLLTPDERLRVDAAGAGLYDTLHRETLEELLREMRMRPISAVVLSTTTLARCGGHAVARVAELVRGFPRVPTVALISEVDGATPHTVLALGGSGVQTLVDTRRPDGWRTLRQALARDTANDLRQLAAVALAGDLTDTTEGCRRFFAALFAAPPEVATVRALAETLGVLPTTLMSRFFRVRLPAPKRYLAMARLIRAARLLENPGCTLNAVAHYLDYSSGQSFSRHVRAILGYNARDLRRSSDAATLLEQFRFELIVPYRETLRTFSPYGHT